MNIIFEDMDGNKIEQNVPFEMNGLAYPANWLDLATDDDLLSHGIIKRNVPDDQPTARVGS